jgi:hypothetical protein
MVGCGSGASDSGGGAGAGGEGGAGGSVGGGGAGAGGNSSGTTAPANGPSGLFEVHYIRTSSIADVGGVMRDGPVAELVVWDKKKTEGDCSLYIPRTPFCEACPTGQVCVDTNVCRAQPTGQSVGNVTLTGLNSATKPLPLTFVAGNYSSAETLALPACTVGDTIGLSATGDGAYPAFSIQAKCVAPLAMSNSSSVMLESGKAFTLTWTPGTVADARITAEFDLSHHGGSKGQVRCEAADTGSLTVSGTLIKSLVDLGVTGFPWLTVVRVVTGTTPVGSGQAKLMVYSDEKFDLELPGLKSCNDSSECPSPQTCMVPSQMCGVACTTNADCPSGQTCQSSTRSCK